MRGGKTATSVSLILFLAVASPCLSSVLGIDFGSEYYKISMIRPGRPFTMVENLYSQTKTYNGITFFDNARLLEYDAQIKASRSTKNSFVFLPKYFGKSYKNLEEINQLAKSHHEDNIVSSKFKDGLFYELDDFVIPDMGEQEQVSERLTSKTSVLRLEEIIGMVLAHAKHISDTFGKTIFYDVVFTVPPWWTPVENEMLYVAAKLAGFNPVAFVSENTAAAVYLAIERKEQDPDKTILFYNMGSQSTKASIIKFDKQLNDKTNKTIERVTLLGEGWDSSLGGYSLDWCITENFAKSFDTKYGTNVFNDAKIMRRLLKSANKVKEVLSANKDASMIVEEVFDYKDFTVRYSREEFEKLCEKDFARVKNPIEQALQNSGLKPSEIDEIEILGGAVRVPKVREVIEQNVGKKAQMHMNGDDSMAQGAVFIAANFTTNLRVKPIVLNHGPNYQVDVIITDPSKVGTEDEFKKEATLFKSGQNYGSRKKLNIQRATDLEVKLSIPTGNGESFTTTYNVTGVAKELELKRNQNLKNPRMTLGFSLDFLGFPYVSRAELLFDKEIKKTAADEIDEDDKKKEGKKDDKKDDKKEEKKEGTETKTEEAKKDDSAKEEIITKVITRTLEVGNLGTNSNSMLHDKKAIKESSAILAKFARYEEFLKKNAEHKNKLESLVYKIQEMVENESIIQYANEEEQADLKKSSEELDEWIYSDEAKVGNYTVFQEKYSVFGKTVRLIEGRIKENEERPIALAEAHKQIDQWETTIKTMNTTRPWLTQEQIDEKIAELEKHRKWLEDKVVEQSERAKNLAPILTLDMIEKKKNAVQELVFELRRVKKPEDKKNDKKDFKIDDEMMEKIKKQMEEEKKKKEDMEKIVEEMMKKQKEEEAKKGESSSNEKATEGESANAGSTEEPEKAKNTDNPVDL